VKVRRLMTPVERLIDAATGHRGDGTAAITMEMRCRECRTSVLCSADASWPEGTAAVEWDACPDCRPPGGGSLRFLDADGEELP
jgi:hypothetical protein